MCRLDIKLHFVQKSILCHAFTSNFYKDLNTLILWYTQDCWLLISSKEVKRCRTNQHLFCILAEATILQLEKVPFICQCKPIGKSKLPLLEDHTWYLFKILQKRKTEIVIKLHCCYWFTSSWSSSFWTWHLATWQMWTKMSVEIFNMVVKGSESPHVFLFQTTNCEYNVPEIIAPRDEAIAVWLVMCEAYIITCTYIHVLPDWKWRLITKHINMPNQAWSMKKVVVATDKLCVMQLRITSIYSVWFWYIFAMPHGKV